MSIKIACISDSPKVTTGFGNVSRMILDGFHKAGFEVYSFGTMDVNYDFKRELPYPFQPTSGFDEMGNREAAMFLVNVQPDVIFILFDPGSIMHYLGLVYAMMDSGNLRKCPIIAYMPIEGVPIPTATANLITRLEESGGKAVVYSPGMINLIQKQFPELKDVRWAYHGLDHAEFKKISDSVRTELRKAVGWSDYFICGSVGVNKRTKGFDTIIYTARVLKDMNRTDNIKFYLHTSALKPTLQGQNLEDMARKYNVLDMLIFKPDVDDSVGGNVQGVARYTDWGGFIKSSSEEESLKNLGYIDRLNLFDCYVDLSQVEGWGLPAHEAMKCGIPTISIKDKSIREEIYTDGAIMLEPMPFRMWTTWQTGVKLVLVDPLDVANAILELKDASPEIREFWSKAAIESSSKYTWKPTQDKFVELVEEVYNNYEYSDTEDEMPIVSD